MNQQSGPVTVNLPPTRGQWINAFVWVVLGVLIGGFFIWLALYDEEVNVVALILAVVVLVIALSSAVLEYRALPGVTLTFESAQLTVRPRRGETLQIALADIDRLETLHVKPIKRRAIRRRDTLSTPPDTSRPTFGSDTAGWHLQVLLTSEESAGPTNGWPIGLNEERTNELRAACQQYRLDLRLAP